jgi:hypothetical protein
MDSQAAAAAIAAARLLSLRLAKRQPLLLAFFAATAVCNFGLGFVPIKSGAYFYGYLICQSILDLLAIGVVRELFSTISADYPGIQTAAKWVLNGAIAVSAIASLIVFLPMRGPAANSHRLFYVLQLHRSIVFCLAVIIISLLIFLSHYPLRLQRNTYTLSYIFSAIVLIDAADALIATMSPLMFSRRVDLASVIAVGICLITWALLMRSEVPLTRSVAFRTAEEDELLQQLEHLNRTLSRVARR